MRTPMYQRLNPYTKSAASVLPAGGMVNARGFSKQSRSDADRIASLIVLDTERKQEMETLVNARSLIIKVIEDIHRKWFFA